MDMTGSRCGCLQCNTGFADGVRLRSTGMQMVSVCTDGTPCTREIFMCACGSTLCAEKRSPVERGGNLFSTVRALVRGDAMSGLVVCWWCRDRCEPACHCAKRWHIVLAGA